MSEHIVRLDTAEHQAVQELLPWFAVNALEDDELILVQEHLRVCQTCKTDADWHSKLKAAQPDMRTAPDLERALARLLPKLDARQKIKKPARGSLIDTVMGFCPGSGRRMQWALAAQSAVIAGFVIHLAFQDSKTAEYRVLGNPSNATGNIVVVFRPETTVQNLQRIMHASGARIVDGPTVMNAYLLSVDNAQQANSIAILKTEPAVELVESLNPKGKP